MGTLKSAAKTIMGFDIFILLLLGFSFLHIEPGSGSYVMAQLTLLPTVASLIAAVVVIRKDWEPFN